MNIFKKRKLILIIFSALMVTVVTWITVLLSGKAGVNELINTKSVGNYSVILTDEGYVPKNLTIKVGSTVTFKTSRDKAHWPASNIHPSHEIYSEFDPKVPIPPDKTWSFTFDKVGRWAFHDHIRSYFIGVVNVVE